MIAATIHVNHPDKGVVHRQHRPYRPAEPARPCNDNAPLWLGFWAEAWPALALAAGLTALAWAPAALP